MDTLMEGKKSGDARPRLRPRARRPRPAAPQVGDGSRRARSTAARGPLRRRHRRRRSSRRRSSARASPRASRSTRSPAYINETALFRNQWQFRPDKTLGETDAEFKERIRPTLRAELDEAKAEGWLVPAVAWGYFPVNADGNDLVVWTDDDRRTERLRLHVPAPAQATVTSASPTSSAASSQRRRRLRRVPRGDRRRRAPASASASCSPPTATRSTSSPTACRSR